MLKSYCSVIITILLLFLTACLSPKLPNANPSSISPTQEETRLETTVLRVVDGDTIIVEIEQKKEYVRLIGIDTPESVHSNHKKNTKNGKIAANFTKKHLAKQSIELEFDVEKKDQYDRFLAYVWLEDTMFNRTLLQEGYARLATFPPNVKYVELFQEDQQQAREAKKGFWANSKFAK